MTTQELDQGKQSGFGCIGRPVKHRFTKKNAPEGDSIKPTDEIISFPSFHTVSKAKSMHSMISTTHILCNPCATLTRTVCQCATLQHPKKIGIEAYIKWLSIQGFSKLSRNVKLRRKKNESGVWTMPKGRIPLREPRKNTQGVSVEKPLGTEIPAHSQ
jgi:hypothetical protein